MADPEIILEVGNNLNMDSKTQCNIAKEEITESGFQSIRHNSQANTNTVDPRILNSNKCKVGTYFDEFGSNQYF